jgi:hypothetical protein
MYDFDGVRLHLSAICGVGKFNCGAQFAANAVRFGNLPQQVGAESQIRLDGFPVFRRCDTKLYCPF